MLWLTAGFIIFILASLAIDMGLFHKEAHVIRGKEALIRTAVWIALALVFGLFVYCAYTHHWLGIGRLSPEQIALGHQALSGLHAAELYLAGYLIEESLSLDNIFVIALIIAYFRIPAAQQHRLLFWGVLAAIVLRGVMIFAGYELVVHFKWVSYAFGALLLATALRMIFTSEHDQDPSRSVLVRWSCRILPVVQDPADPRFMARHDDRWKLTTMGLVLVIINVADIIFAVDSIPAVFAIFPKKVAPDFFIVFTSNIFAVMGLRSMYFALAALLDRFRYLKQSLVIILLLVGLKMLLAEWVHVSPTLSLIGVVVILLGGILGSCLRPAKQAD